MKIPVLLLSCLVVTNLHAASWAPSADLLRDVRRVESANGRFTVGDQGRSLGDYQISEAAWCDVTAWRRGRGLRTYDYAQHVWSESISRAYAADYLKILHGQLEKRLGRSPSTHEVYAAYNMGLSCFAKTGYRVTSSKLSDPCKDLPLQTALLK